MVCVKAMLSLTVWGISISLQAISFSSASRQGCLQMPFCWTQYEEILKALWIQTLKVMWSSINVGRGLCSQSPKPQGLAQKKDKQNVERRRALVEVQIWGIFHCTGVMTLGMFSLSQHRQIFLKSFIDNHHMAHLQHLPAVCVCVGRRQTGGTQWQPKIQHLNKPRFVNFWKKRKRISDVQLSATHTQSQHVVFLFGREKKAWRQGCVEDVWTAMALLLCSRARLLSYLLTRATLHRQWWEKVEGPAVCWPVFQGQHPTWITLYKIQITYIQKHLAQKIWMNM